MNEELKKDLYKKLDKLEDLDLGLGAHLINGWQGQYERMLRFYQRYLSSEDSTDKLDFALTFFVYSYHLKEWIQKYEQIEKSKFDIEWKKFIDKYPEIQLCRDICNVNKHLILSQQPSIDKHFAIFWSYDYFETKESDWVIHYDDKRTKLISLMHQVTLAWNEFIKEHLKLII